MEHWWTDPSNGRNGWQPVDHMFGTTDILSAGPVAVGLRGSDNIDVFALSGGNLLHRSYTDQAGWQPIETLPSSSGVGQPAAVSWGPERLDVFAIKGGALIHWWIDPKNGFASWKIDRSLQGSKLSGGPAAVSWGSERLDVFATNANNDLLHWWFDGPNGVNFGAPETINTDCSGPFAVSWESQRLDVFAISTVDNSISWLTYDATHKQVQNFNSNKPQTLGSSQHCGPACAVSWGPGRFDVFAANAQGQFLHWWNDSTVAGGPGIVAADMLLANQQSPGIGVLTNSAPAAASPGVGLLEVVAVASGGGMLIDHWTWK